MYRVAICEDEDALREELLTQCEEILTTKGVAHAITPFPSAEALLRELTQGERFDLLCLDIMMRGMTGMELALEVRCWDETTSILFITGSTEFLLEGYRARPIQYLLKPVKSEELAQALETDLRLHYHPQSVTLEARGQTAVLPLQDIRYVESKNHSCLFHTSQEERLIPMSLGQVETLLPTAQFGRCHNSFLVNMRYIRKAGSREILLEKGERLPVGRRYASQFQTQFVRYLNRK